VSPEKSMHAKQEILQFEPVNRGRFEKSEPTIVEGEDLDVPTYLRKKIKVK
jgi:cell division protein FtsZ